MRAETEAMIRDIGRDPHTVTEASLTGTMPCYDLEETQRIK